ncbi:MAG: methyltransferase domain-containing protein [Polyangia bacterium]
MTASEQKQLCWVCGGSLSRYLQLGPVRINSCRRCDHLTARPPPVGEPGSDYHLSYDQTRFLSALTATRRRQAKDIMAALSRHGADSDILDYGCGRGFFLEACMETGLRALAGADTSDLAISHLRGLGLETIRVEADNSLVSDWTALSFVPKTITFLDVIEHFPDDMVATFSSWLARLPRQTRFFVFKVPCRDGVLFRASRCVSLLGVSRPITQLFQIGTFPPHLQYFSSMSLRLFVKNLGLAIVEEWGDPDVEPDKLRDRAPTMRILPPALVSSTASLMIRCGRTLGLLDSRIVLAVRG